MVCLTPQLFLLVYPHANVGSPSPPADTLPHILSAHLIVSTPPTSLNECFFNSLVVRLHTVQFSGSSGCFLFLKLLLFFFWLCEEAQCILPTSPSWLEVLKGHRFDSQSGHMPGLWAGFPVGGVREATDRCFSCTSMFLSLFSSLPSPLSKDK